MEKEVLRSRAFFSASSDDAEDRRRAVLRASRPLAPEVAAVLAAQNARFTQSALRDEHLAALSAGAAAVVTGQQVGLFLGPLYTIYKAAAAIRIARSLAAETGGPVVPIFWLQTEDHDLPEIATATIPSSRGEPLDVSVPASAGDRRSISERALPEELGACLEVLRAELGNLPHAAAHLERLAEHYRPGRGYSEAFAAVLSALFAPEGLLLIDPRDPALGAVTAPVHRRSLREATRISQALRERVEALSAAGFAAPIFVREGAPLSFFHPAGREGPRFRLEPVDGGLQEVGGGRVHSTAELEAVLEKDPLAFSTSALLRPILQDSLLPTAAYVGGPGEIAYFAQLEPLYRIFELNMPLIVPRAHFRVIEEKTLRILARLGIGADRASRSEEELLADARALERAPYRPEELEAELGGRIDLLLDEVLSRIEPLGQGLDTAVDKTRATMKGAAAKLREKYERAVLHQDQAIVGDVRRLRALLYPRGAPQERVYGFPYYAARYGERAFIERVLEAIVPFDGKLRDLTLGAVTPAAEAVP